MVRYLFTNITMLFIVCGALVSQPYIKGRVTEQGHGIGLATVRIAHSHEGTTTDSTGRFILYHNTEQTTILLEVSHAAYETAWISVPANTTQEIPINLTPKNIRTDEVIIISQGKSGIQQTFAGKQTLSQKEILGLPTFLGESDVIKAVQLTAGIQSVSEGHGGVFVRGGGAGQNLFLLDDMELLNPSHLMGIYSVFNPLTTGEAEIHKGHAPIHMQGRLSSTIAVRSRTPQPESQGVEGHIGNISSNVVWSTISKDNKISLITGFRRSYLEGLGAVASLFMKNEKNYFKTNHYAFYDWNGKINFKMGYSSQLSLSWYLGNDDFYIKNPGITYNAGTQWGNRCAALSFRHTTPRGMVMKHSIDVTHAYSGFEGSLLENLIGIDSRMTQWNQKNQWTYSNEAHLCDFGLETSYQSTTPEDFRYIYINDSIKRETSFRNAIMSIYAGDKIKLTPQTELYAGIRVGTNQCLGPYQYHHADETDTDIAAWNQAKNYMYWSTVVALSVKTRENEWIKAAFSKNVQQVHLASISSIPLPNDLWVSATPRLRPENSYQLSAGYYFKHKQIELSIEAYGKYLDNQLIYKVNQSKEERQNFEDDFFHGEGFAYGTDISLSKKKGLWTGSINYSLAQSRRSFPDIYNGQWFDDKYDRRHDLNLTSNYRINPKWDIGMVWIFATGNTTTLPSGRWWMMGSVMNDYIGYNNFRFPPYHRLDLSVNRTFQSKRFKESILNFSIINLYSRANPYFMFYKVYKGTSQYDIDIRATQISLFPIMPSVSWRFKF
ncbi:TonB-dependent receptor-like protein [Breznakibacter xylanolyticus]|uniref:TonB-dependent receptor-like protein n=1 Tax=Breznakibacter xylanolyticus TaxID=990 RepID=A0A2W7P1Z9_9BACT|nr:TonB-dependent receptor [Breznakibacter xylanolyticus]PZX19456.1 TonB-dependent receptor-like protein [Breznakibacter xylanolyticus]